MNKLILTVGLPRSGKSTWSLMQGLPVVNPDSIRLALHGTDYIKEAEPMVWVLAKYMVRSLFFAGHETVILDATNTSKERRDFWISSEWETELKIFKTKSDECIRRAKECGKENLVPVIISMENKSDFWELNDGLLEA